MNIWDFFNKEDLDRLFEEWASEAEEYAKKKAKLDEYMRRSDEASTPFRRKEEELLEEKRRQNEKLTVEERDEIWDPFREIHRKIFDEIYGKKKRR